MRHLRGEAYGVPIKRPYPDCFGRVTRTRTRTGAAGTALEALDRVSVMSESRAASQHPANPTETASWLSRIGALFIDWLASYLVTLFILRDVQHPAFGVLSLIVFWLQSAVGVALAGSSFGQAIAKVQVRHPDGRPLSLFGALLRQLLVCLVIPPLVFREDGRGLHDLWTASGAYEVG